MRAIVVSQWGGPEVLTETELDRPEPGMGEILVRVHAAGVNPVDWKTRASGASSPGARSRPSAGTCPARSRPSDPG